MLALPFWWCHTLKYIIWHVRIFCKYTFEWCQCFSAPCLPWSMSPQDLTNTVWALTTMRCGRVKIGWSMSVFFFFFFRGGGGGLLPPRKFFFLRKDSPLATQWIPALDVGIQKKSQWEKAGEIQLPEVWRCWVDGCHWITSFGSGTVWVFDMRTVGDAVRMFMEIPLRIARRCKFFSNWWMLLCWKPVGYDRRYDRYRYLPRIMEEESDKLTQVGDKATILRSHFLYFGP